MATGFVEAFRIHGAPVFVHWTLLLIDLCIAAHVYVVASVFFVDADWRVVMVIGCCCVYTMSIAAHEFGHATAARFAGLKVHYIQLSASRSYCRTDLPRSIRSAFFLLSAGPLANLVLLAVAASYVAAFGWPPAVLGQCVIYAFAICNVVIFILTLIPYRWRAYVSDGLVLWQLLMHVVRDAPYPWLVPKSISKVFPPQTSLLAKACMKPVGFKTGLEILNDDKTPMDFVIRTFMRNLKIDEASATTVMIMIHNNGGVLLPTRDIREAERIALEIAEDCRTYSQPLICRAVGDMPSGH